jgi:hypothetical protein
MFTNSTSTKFIVIIQNNLGARLFFPVNSLLVSPGYFQNTSYTGACLPQNAVAGSTIVCNATFTGFGSTVGSQLNPKFTISYELCDPTCTSRVYNTTGNAVTTLSPYKSVVFDITLLTNPTSSNIAVSGVPYGNGATVPFISGLSYPIYAIPPNGLATFVQWIASSNVVLSSGLQSTTAMASGIGSITASFVSTTTSTTTIPYCSCNSCINPFSCTCPASCPQMDPDSCHGSTEKCITTSSSTTTTTSSTTTINYIYCVGTVTSPSNYAYYAPVLSTGVGAWTSGTTYPISLYYTGCSISGNYIYCVGSFTSPSNYVYYAPLSSTGIGAWTAAANYPVAIYGEGCSAYNNYLYCIGNEAAPNNFVYYAPVSSTGVGAWTRTTGYPFTAEYVACSIYNGFIYCVGSATGTEEQVYYAPVTTTGIAGAWLATTSYPIQMAESGCSAYNGYIYCVGTGYTPPNNYVYYAPLSSTGVGAWTSTTVYPIGIDLAGCAINNGYIYCVGSPVGANNEVYFAQVSPAGVGTWTATTNYPVAMLQAYCGIPGSGGGFMGGGGPNSGSWPTTTTTVTTTSTSTTSTSTIPNIVFVSNYAKGESSGSTISVVMSKPNTGDALVAVIGDVPSSGLVTVSSITQTGVTWTKQVSTSESLGSYTYDDEIWLGIVGSNPGTVVTVTLSGTATYGAVADINEYSGVATSGALDKTATNSGKSASASTGMTATTTQANELWVGGISGDYYSQNFPTNGFTLSDGTLYNYISVGYLQNIVSSTGQADSAVTLSTSNDWAGCIATFEA